MIPFSEILGQERAVRLLREAMAREKMPHAYLFVGIPGVGKTTTALAFCRTLNCQHPQGGEGCGQCSSCRRLASGNYPDLVILEPESQVIKIEQVRALDRVFSFKPVAGRYRLTIIRQAETMTEEAANAFLKTLEEPPPGNILILNVAEPLDLLPTILSRCRRVSFHPVSEALIEAWLVRNQGIEQEKASLLARMAEGSPGKALDMSGNEFLEKRQDLLSSLHQIIHLPSHELVQWALGYCGRERNEKKESTLSFLLRVWKTWYRDLVLTKAACPEKSLVNVDFSRELKNASRHFSIENLLESFFVLDKAERDAQRSRNLDLLVETAVLGLKRSYGAGSKAGE